MVFVFDTVYNKKALTAMAKTVRKTVRKKKNRRSRAFGWIVVALALLLTLPLGNREFSLNFRTVITWLAALAVLFVMCFEDRINGAAAGKRMLAGTERAKSVFHRESFNSVTELGRTEWKYETIQMVAETRDYFVLVFDQSHAQVYDKDALSGGTVKDFRKFIAKRTGKEVRFVK